jgi:hypothetical protein
VGASFSASKQKQRSSRNQPGKSREKDPRRSKRSYDQRSKIDPHVKRSREIIPEDPGIDMIKKL